MLAGAPSRGGAYEDGWVLDMGIRKRKFEPQPQESAASDAAGSAGVRPAGVWVEQLERAVRQAEAPGSQDSWRDVARTATVMFDIARVMAAAADAKKSAQHAAEAARIASEKDGEARRVAEQTAQVARQKAEAARQAAEAAAAAERAAAQAADVVTQAAEAARVAVAAATAAKRVAVAFEATVAGARASNTPEAWNSAVRQVENGGVAERAEPDAPAHDAVPGDTDRRTPPAAAVAPITPTVRPMTPAARRANGTSAEAEAASPSPAPSGETLEKIQRLSAMHETGQLSDTEFEQMTKDILAR